MRVVKFDGPDTNLGRFGMVTSGDLLALTDREAAAITEDKRFLIVDDYTLSKEDRDAVARITIAEMNHDELVEYCKQIQEADPSFKFRRDMSHQTLMALVRQRMLQEAKNPSEHDPQAVEEPDPPKAKAGKSKAKGE